jgi:type IV pilus assembly protein PilW
MTIVSTKQAGLSLIELMISITLGLLLVLGATQVFLSSKNTYSYNEEIGWMQENARFALEQLKRDVRMAGFWGCNTDGDFVSTLNPMPSGNGWQIDFTRAVRGWDGDDAAYPSPEFPGRPGPAVSAGPTVPDSDLLTIRRADDSMGQFNVVGTHNPSSAVIPIDGTHPFQSGDILVVTDCTNTAVFQHTGNGSNKANHNTGGGGGLGPPGNCTKDLGGPAVGACGASTEYEYKEDNGATVMRAQAYAYYVDTAPNGVPSLYRRELDSGSAAVVSQELVQGVENVQVLYGEDLNNDSSPERYVNADDVGDWSRVTVVRLHMLVRSLIEVAQEPQQFRLAGTDYTPSDRYLRQQFVSTIKIRNK